MSATRIRRAGPGDADGVLECLRLAFEPYRDSYTAGGFEDTVLSGEAIAGRLTEMRVLVATTEVGQVAGTIGYRIIDGIVRDFFGMRLLEYTKRLD